MRKGLVNKLVLAAPLVVCLPLSALCADTAASSDEPAARIFEDYSLTPLTKNSQPAAAGSESKVVQTSAIMSDASSPCVAAQPASSASAPCVSQPCVSPPNCCQTYGEPFKECNDKCLFISGVDATIFHVQTKGMSVDSSVERFQDGTTFDQSNSQVFDQFTFAPRIYAGVQQDCWGIMGRFWYMSDSTNRLDPFFPIGNPTGQYTMDRVKAYTIDVEGTRAFCLWGSKFDGFFGMRYASFEAGQGIDITRLTNVNEIFYTNAFSKFSFNGLGLTMGFQGRTPVTCDGCVNLLYGVRGSVLWGDASRNAQTSATVVELNAAATSTNSATADNTECGFIVEAILGVQWDHELKCLPMSAFLRVAMEYQFWDLGGDGSAFSHSFAVSNTGRADSTASVGNVDTNMFGLTVGTGFSW